MSHRWLKPTLISMIVVSIPMQVALAYGPQWRPSGINLQQHMPQQLPRVAPINRGFRPIDQAMVAQANQAPTWQPIAPRYAPVASPQPAFTQQFGWRPAAKPFLVQKQAPTMALREPEQPKFTSAYWGMAEKVRPNENKPAVTAHRWRPESAPATSGLIARQQAEPAPMMPQPSYAPQPYYPMPQMGYVMPYVPQPYMASAATSYAHGSATTTGISTAVPCGASAVHAICDSASHPIASASLEHDGSYVWPYAALWTPDDSSGNSTHDA